MYFEFNNGQLYGKALIFTNDDKFIMVSESTNNRCLEPIGYPCVETTEFVCSNDYDICMVIDDINPKYIYDGLAKYFLLGCIHHCH